MNDIGVFTAFRNLLKDSDLHDLEGLKAVKQLASAFEEEDERAWALCEIVINLAETLQWDNAEETAQAITMSYEKARGFTEIAIRLLAAHDIQRALRDLGIAEDAVSAGETNWMWQRAERLAEIARVLAEAKEREHALRVWDQAIAFARIGEHVPSHDSEDCSRVLLEIAEDLATRRCLDKARATANTIKHPVKRERAIARVEELSAKGAGDDEDT